MFASLGLVTVMRIPILAFGVFLSWNQLYNSLYVPFFYTRLIF
jgi:hypothetical protein